MWYVVYSVPIISSLRWYSKYTKWRIMGSNISQSMWYVDRLRYMDTVLLLYIHGRVKEKKGEEYLRCQPLPPVVCVCSLFLTP